MKTLLLALLIAVAFASCSTVGKCPTTNKRYFTKGVKPAKSLYGGYRGVRGNPSWKN